MEDPFTFQLAKVNWQFFGTLTFRKAAYPEGKRTSMFFSLIRRVCKKADVQFLKSLWVLREEKGEMFGRTHFHFLLSGLPERWENEGMCWALMGWWREITLTPKMRALEIKPKVQTQVNIRLFDKRLTGCQYVLKGLEADDAYESSKFGRESVLTLSHGLQRVLHSKKCI